MNLLIQTVFCSHDSLGTKQPKQYQRWNVQLMPTKVSCPSVLTATDITSLWVIVGSIFLRTMQCLNCHIRDKARNVSQGWKRLCRAWGGPGHARPSASEASVRIPEQGLTESACCWVSTCQNSWSEDERKKKHIDIDYMNKPPKSNTCITKHNMWRNNNSLWKLSL